MKLDSFFHRAFLMLLSLLIGFGLSRAKCEEALQEYVIEGKLEGKLKVGGSNFDGLLEAWLEEFRHLQPSIEVSVESSKGSATGTAPLIEGKTQICSMARLMSEHEVTFFFDRFGYEPTLFRVACKVTAIIVQKDNPLGKIDLTQLDSIFSSTLKNGGKERSKTWGQLGLSGTWRESLIDVYVPSSASSDYGNFREKILEKGEFRSDAKEQVSGSVVSRVASSRASISFVDVGMLVNGVKPLAVASSANEESCTPSQENCLSGKYPLSHYYYVYCNKKPGKSLDPIVGQFLKFILSKQGQAIVAKIGHCPMNGQKALSERQKLE